MRESVIDRPSVLRFLIVRHGADIEQVFVNGVGLHFTDEAGQDVKADVGWDAGRDGVKKVIARNHNAGKGPMAARVRGLFFEVDDEAARVGDSDAAARRVGDLIKTKSGNLLVKEMEVAHAPQVHIGENVGVENPEGGIGCYP